MGPTQLEFDFMQTAEPIVLNATFGPATAVATFRPSLEVMKSTPQPPRRSRRYVDFLLRIDGLWGLGEKVREAIGPMLPRHFGPAGQA